MGIGNGGREGREGVVQGCTHMPSNGLASLTCLLVCCGFAVKCFAMVVFCADKHFVSGLAQSQEMKHLAVLAC